MDSELPVVENDGGRARLCSISAARLEYIARRNAHPSDMTLPVPPGISLAEKTRLADRFESYFNADEYTIEENFIRYLPRRTRDTATA